MKGKDRKVIDKNEAGKRRLLKFIECLEACLFSLIGAFFVGVGVFSGWERVIFAVMCLFYFFLLGMAYWFIKRKLKEHEVGQ